MRAKVKLISKTTTEYGAQNGQVQLNFQAVTGPGNEEWASATPNLQLSMTVKKEIGDSHPFGEYYLTFEEVDHA